MASSSSAMHASSDRRRALTESLDTLERACADMEDAHARWQRLLAASANLTPTLHIASDMGSAQAQAEGVATAAKSAAVGVKKAAAAMRKIGALTRVVTLALNALDTAHEIVRPDVGDRIRALAARVSHPLVPPLAQHPLVDAARAASAATLSDTLLNVDVLSIIFGEQFDLSSLAKAQRVCRTWSAAAVAVRQSWQLLTYSRRVADDEVPPIQKYRDRLHLESIFWDRPGTTARGLEECNFLANRLAQLPDGGLASINDSSHLIVRSGGVDSQVIGDTHVLALLSNTTMLYIATRDSIRALDVEGFAPTAQVDLSTIGFGDEFAGIRLWFAGEHLCVGGYGVRGQHGWNSLAWIVKLCSTTLRMVNSIDAKTSQRVNVLSKAIICGHFFSDGHEFVDLDIRPLMSKCVAFNEHDASNNQFRERNLLWQHGRSWAMGVSLPNNIALVKDRIVITEGLSYRYFDIVPPAHEGQRIHVYSRDWRHLQSLTIPRAIEPTEERGPRWEDYLGETKLQLDGTVWSGDARSPLIAVGHEDRKLVMFELTVSP